ncbi:MAG: 3-hydroxyacyl-ACP dehydratase FabZ, partial [Planctomycetota bacterium]|nr:3-hydroxyacyl-ACP dehydratase FabZ [Planctomycetota bacterium]
RIPRQSAALALTPETFATEIAPARTFCLEEEAEALRQAGLGRHHREGDMLVFGADGPIATELRFPEEPARHKILDLIGDLALTGRRIQGRLFAARSGHELNRRLALSLVHDLPVDPKLLREGRAMDIRSIQRALPHRYPMLLVDRVLELDGDQKAIGIKNVSINEPFFQGHYPNVPIMPGVLIVEAMAQLGGLLVSNTVDNTGKTPVLLSLDGVKIRKPVTPGDQLVLEAETIQVRARIISVRCRATVAGTLAAEARIRFMLIEEDSVD